MRRVVLRRKEPRISAIESADALPLTVALPADRHPVAVYLARLGAGSRRTMAGALETIAGILTGGKVSAQALAWHALRYQHTAAIRASLAESKAPATANKMLAALRGVLHEAWRLGLMNAEDMHRACDLAPVRGETLPRGRGLTGGELCSLFRACAADEGPGGRRDAALLAVLYGGGLRRAEAVALTMADYDPETGALTIRNGKGHKARTAYATNGAREALTAWLAVRGTDDGALFSPVLKSGRVPLRPMTAQSVLLIVARLADAAGVKRFTPHDLRRSFISDLLDAGTDIVTVKDLAGHSNVQTTARYDRRGEATKKRAAELLHVPYKAT